MSDDRFSRFSTDPKFRPVPRKERKAVVDDRFKGMFKDKRFVSKVTVDKRGRPAKSKSSDEDYKKYYRLEDGEDSEDDDSDDDDNANQEDSASSDESDDEGESVSDFNPIREEVVTDSGGDSSSSLDQAGEASIVAPDNFPVASEKDRSSVSSQASSDKNIKPKIKRKLKDLKVDYARGEGRLDSGSSSSEDESSSEEEEEEEEEEEAGAHFDKWGELDKDAETTDEATSRLAVCNMDWDRVGAEDIFIAMNSFCPTGGNVKCVKVRMIMLHKILVN